ncbi:hypothetical protein NCS56_01460300 [Fusarium sp. Ph1]|nr:hypothetical protein NCS56_01460300 [Fusarium sp. Ph1]
MFGGRFPRKVQLECCTVPSQRCRVSRPFSTQPLLHHRSHLRSPKMSWMDSWSRPSKSQATPAPFYLLPGGEATPYCHSCGRVISNRRTTVKAKANDTPVKYCSSRCRTNKPGKLDRELETTFVQLLSAEDGGQAEVRGKTKGQGGVRSKKKGKQSKGDDRILVPCSAVEDHVFGPHRLSMEESEPENEDVMVDTTVPLPQGLPGVASAGEDMDLSGNKEGDSSVDGHVLVRMAVRSGTRIRPPQSVSEVNGNVGGEKGRAERIQETDAMVEKRKEGQKRAKEREMTKCAARRGVVFGFLVGEERRLCEAVMAGKAVEPSFAKGDWSIRWRE